MNVHVFLAYIDPGAGSLLIQLLIGGLAGLAALIKFRWNRIKAVFSKKPQEESNG